jgi:N-acetylglutamate synthase-like GNAT family acetyltransferase
MTINPNNTLSDLPAVSQPGDQAATENPEPQMRIRQATQEETHRLMEIAEDAKRYWGYAPQEMESWHSTMTLDVSRIELSPPYVIEKDSQVVGFYQLIADGSQMELEHMWVMPQFMNQGIGKQLMAHAIAQARARGANKIVIDTEPNATAFYLSCGARRVGQGPTPGSHGSGQMRQLLEIDLTSAKS